MAYSIIALQELNLNLKYNPLYWNTACLTVNSASFEEDELDSDDEEESEKKSRSTNYGKVAAAIGKMQQLGVKISLPDINKAGFGFIPDIENNQIIYGLKGLVGIGDDIVQSIIENRPYSSFEDFYERMCKTSIVTNSKLVQLIKAGCFESFGSREEIMNKFISSIFQPKEALNMRNFSAVVENNLLPNHLKIYERIIKYKKYVSTLPKEGEKGKTTIKLDKRASEFFEQYFNDNDVIVGYDEHSLLIISESKFNKQYEKKLGELREWLSDPKTLDSLNKKLYESEYKKYAEGTVSKWEMDSLSFYYTEHELKNVDIEMYDISYFNSLPEQPEVESYYTYKGSDRPKFKLTSIAGTVLDKNKNKHTVTLLTIDGEVVTVKYYDGAFAHYNKQISKSNGDKKEILEKSWFTRGNKLLVYGYRRGSQFRPTKYWGSKYQHTTMLINEVFEDGSLSLSLERKSI